MDGLEFYMGNLIQVQTNDNKKIEGLRAWLRVAFGYDHAGFLIEQFRI